MNKLSLIITGFAFLAFFSLSQCKSGNNGDNESGDTTISQLEQKMDTLESSGDTTMQGSLGKEYTSAYICPMHCEGSGSDKPGKCTVCGMDMIENPNAKAK